MNSHLPDNDPSIIYNDSDYPSGDHGLPENFDDITNAQGLAHDVDRYREIAAGIKTPVLEIGCGSGRVGIALARAGHEVVGVDVSAGMLARYRKKLENEPDDLCRRIRLIEADATMLDLDRVDFDLAIIPFNTLLCIPEFDDQQAALTAIGRHMRPGGRLIIDIMNPHKLAIHGDQIPKPFFTRTNVWTGRPYTRFAAMSPLDTDQHQKLYGWYDEIREDGAVMRKPYSITWRPIFRYEAALMLEKAGFEIEKIEGGHQGEPFMTDSLKMFIGARKTAALPD